MNSDESAISSDLVSRIQKGDALAESQMVERYQRGLLFVLNRKSNDQALANDIAQDTWQLVIQKVRAGELRDSSKLSGYIIQIAKNQLIMHFRKAEHARTEALDAHLDIAPDVSPTPERSLELKHLKAMTLKMLSELKVARDRELMLRFYIKEQEKKYICQELGIASDYFDKVIFRARQRLRKLYEGNEAAYDH